MIPFHFFFILILFSSQSAFAGRTKVTDTEAKDRAQTVGKTVLDKIRWTVERLYRNLDKTPKEHHQKINEYTENYIQNRRIVDTQNKDSIKRRQLEHAELQAKTEVLREELKKLRENQIKDPSLPPSQQIIDLEMQIQSNENVLGAKPQKKKYALIPFEMQLPEVKVTKAPIMPPPSNEKSSHSLYKSIWNEKNPEYSALSRQVSTAKQALKRQALHKGKKTEAEIKLIEADLAQNEARLKQMKFARKQERALAASPFPNFSTAGFPSLPDNLNTVRLFEEVDFSVHSLQNPESCFFPAVSPKRSRIETQNNTGIPQVKPDPEPDPFFMNMHSYPDLLDPDLFFDFPTPKNPG